MRNIARSVWLPCEAGARRAAATSAGIVKRASRAKLEGIVEEEREGRGQGEVEPDDRVGFPTEIARGIASREREKRGGTHFGCVAESFSRASFRLSPPVNPKRWRWDCFMMGPVAAMACSRISSPHPTA